MSLKTFEPFVYGGIASCFSEMVTFPIDLVKTRLQVQGQLTNNHTARLKYSGMFNCFNVVVKEEGLRALYAGVKPAILRQATYGTLKLGFYQIIKKKLARKPGETNLMNNIISGMVSGAVAMTICNPTDVLKVRMQANGTCYGSQGVFFAFTEIYKTEGLKGLYRGTAPNAQRTAVIAAAELASYDSTKQYLLNTLHLDDNILVHVIASGIAGICGAVATTPLDVVKTRMMNQQNLKNRQNNDQIYRNSLDCISKTVRNEGVLALYKGLIPSYLRIGPWTMIFFLTYEKCKDIFPLETRQNELKYD